MEAHATSSQPSRRNWQNTETAYLLANYQTKRLCELATDLGRNYHTVVSQFDSLVKKGRASYHLRAYQPQWSAEELRFLRDCVGRPGWTLALLAERLGRTENAIKLKLKRLRHRKPVTGRTERTLSQRQVCEVLGIPDRRPVRDWLLSKALRGTRVPTGRADNRTWAVYPADLVEFLQQHPECYDYDRIPRTVDGKPNPYRQHARRYDPTAGHLPLKQAARRLGIAGKTLQRWHKERRLTLVRFQAPNVHPKEWFMAITEAERIERERVRLLNGWWTLPKGDAL